MGSLIVMAVYYIANEIMIRKGFLDDPKVEEVAPTLE